MLNSADSVEERFATVCIEANDAATKTLRMNPIVLGRHKFSITAEVDSAYPGECGPEILINRKYNYCIWATKYTEINEI